MAYQRLGRDGKPSEESGALGDGFGARLKQERQRTGMTQAKFAKIAGVSRASQANYEQEVRVPDLHYLAALIRSVDVDYIVAGNEASLRDSRNVNVESMIPIVRFFDSLKREASAELPVEARARLLALLVHHVIRTGRIDVEMMRLAAGFLPCG